LIRSNLCGTSDFFLQYRSNTFYECVRSLVGAGTNAVLPVVVNHSVGWAQLDSVSLHSYVTMPPGNNVREIPISHVHTGR